jgi:hypothetical protein
MSSDVKFWRYYVPSVDGVEGWGIFILDSTGMFSAVTDYGNAAYKFDVRAGEDIRKYFAKGVPGNLMEKLFYDLQRYDGDETLIRVKKCILEGRRNGSYSSEQARAEWDLLEKNDWLDNEADFVRWYDDSIIYDSGELYTMGYPPSCNGFVNKLMPRLCSAIAKELADESAGVAV